jgi:hypothetical protein
MKAVENRWAITLDLSLLWLDTKNSSMKLQEVNSLRYFYRNFAFLSNDSSIFLLKVRNWFKKSFLMSTRK